MSCDRFVEEGLTVYPLTPERVAHLASCEACRSTSERYARLERLIGLAHSDAEPPPGWEGRLLDAMKAGPRRARWPGRVALGSALFAAALGLLVLRAGVGHDEQPSVTALVELPTGVRAASAGVGGTYRIEAKAWKEARVWLNGKTLVGRCPGGPACEGHGAGLRLSVPLTVAGEYRVMVLKAGEGEPLSEPASLDEDVRLVRERHGQYEVLEPLSVY